MLPYSIMIVLLEAVSVPALFGSINKAQGTRNQIGMRVKDGNGRNELQQVFRIYMLRGGATIDKGDKLSREDSSSCTSIGEIKAKKKEKRKSKSTGGDDSLCTGSGDINGIKKKNSKNKTKKMNVVEDEHVIDEKIKLGKIETEGGQISSQTTAHKTQTISKKYKKKVKNAKSGECLRRIKHEWKNMVELGIGYDWISQQTIASHDSKGGSSNQREGHFYKYNYIRIGPLQNNLLHWHFSVQGPSNSVYQNGIYHGRIILPKTYPGHPPRIQILTPSGRFVTGEDICLSVSAFHPETWSPRWTILSLVDALRMHMLTTANEIGGLHKSDEMRKKFAVSSRNWKLGCFDHGRMIEDGIFCPPPTEEEFLEDNDGSNDMVENKNHEFEKMSDEQCDEVNGDSSVSINKKKVIDHAEEFMGSAKGKEKHETKAKQLHHTVSSPSIIAKRKKRLERRPAKQSIVIVTIRDIVEFFLRNLPLGIIFVGVFICLR